MIRKLLQEKVKESLKNLSPVLIYNQTSYIIGGYRIFTVHKNQLELSDSLIENILTQSNELIKLK